MFQGSMAMGEATVSTSLGEEPAGDGSLASLDFLGRMPLPLRRPFKAGLDEVLRQTTEPLRTAFLLGSDWYAPFDRLAAIHDPADLPALVVSSWSSDIFKAGLLDLFAGARPVPGPVHPAAMPLIDPMGQFSVFGAIPLVFLVDLEKLGGRPVPRCWEDLLDPMFRDSITFGGWRPNPGAAFADYNEFLLLCLHERFGRAGIRAFATNVKGLLHNVRAARLCGSGSDETGAVAVLPWLQADLCPRRAESRVVWPIDGAFAMPIGSLMRPGAEARVRPIEAYLNGDHLADLLARNRYPPVGLAVAKAFPEGARLTWPGWDFVRTADVRERTREAARQFFAAHATLKGGPS